MQINTEIVSSLMSLRQISIPNLANLSHVDAVNLKNWLSNGDESAENGIDFDTQLEVLRILGISGEGPRPDVIHQWYLYEPLFSSKTTTYYPLSIVLKSFGPAKIAHLAKKEDSFFELKANFKYILKFESFIAVLDIKAHPLKTISFDPDDIEELSWVSEDKTLVLSEADFHKMRPGALKVGSVSNYLTYSADASQWDKLRDAALEKGLKADQVATMLLGKPIAELPVALPHTPISATSESSVLKSSGDHQLDEFTKAMRGQLSSGGSKMIIDDDTLFSNPIDKT